MYGLGKIFVPAGGRYDVETDLFTTKEACYLRRIIAPSEIAKAFPSGEISIAGRKPISFAFASNEAGVFEADLDGLASYTDLKLMPGEKVSMSGPNISNEPRKFQAAVLVRFPTPDVERCQVEWTVHDSGYVQVNPQARQTLSVRTEKSFKTETVRLVGASGLIILSLKVSNVEQLADRNGGVPAKVLDGQVGIKLDISRGGTEIEVVVQNVTGEAISSCLNLEGVELDVSKARKLDDDFGDDDDVDYDDDDDDCGDYGDDE